MARRHRRKLDDPLLPIRGDNLTVLLKLEGVTANGLARELAHTRTGRLALQRTLSNILQGKQKRARTSLIERLAARFGVSRELLTGEPGPVVSGRIRCAIYWNEAGGLLRALPRLPPTDDPTSRALERQLARVADNFYQAVRILRKLADSGVVADQSATRHESATL